LYKLSGGTLIHPDIILTAAHCEPEAFTNGSYIGGVTLSGSTSEKFNVSQIVTNPDYNETNRQNDVMLVKIVGTSSAPLQRLNFNQDFPPVGEVVTVIGFGKPEVELTGRNISDILLQVNVDIQSSDRCRELYGNVFNPAIQICAGVVQGGRDSCQVRFDILVFFVTFLHENFIELTL
jgi:trypsin